MMLNSYYVQVLSLGEGSDDQKRFICVNPGRWQRVLVGAHLWSFTTMRASTRPTPPSSAYRITVRAYHLA